jgi:aminomethyltransferase
MVDFGGWDMPVHYGSQIEEHHAVRHDCGMFDVSHMRVVECDGEAATAYLQRLLANDVRKLTHDGKALYGCMLNPSGGVVDDLIVYRRGTGYRLVVNAATAEGDIAWMHEVAADGRFQVRLTPRPDLAMLAVQGPSARARVFQVLPGSEAATATLKPFSAAEANGHFIARTGYTGEDGFEIVLPAGRAATLWEGLRAVGVRPAGLGARDTLRLEAGMALYGNDLGPEFTPLESGLGWTVDRSTPRDFIGRAALDAAAPTRQMVGLLLEGKGVLRAHQRVSTPHGDGETTSGTFSPTLQRSIALARVPQGVATGETVQVDIRGHWLPCRVVRYPFVRNGKAQIAL